MTVDAKFMERLAYAFPRQLPDGRWIGLQRQMYTISLVVGLDETAYQSRYCYELERTRGALCDLLVWDGQGDPAGLWIKHKGRGAAGGDELNPRWLAEAKDELKPG